MNTIIFDASKMFHAPLYNKAENDIISAGGGKMYAKKLITINILRILQGHSDAAHPISQKEIIKYLKDEYGMEVDRKAVRRNIDFLIDAGYEIKPASPEKKRMMPNGETGEKEEQPLITDIYLVRDFSDAELRMLIDSVLFSGHIPHSQRKELAEKFESLSSKYFRSHMKHVLTVPDNLPENPQLFLNIELLGEAIYEGRKVSFQYLEYGVDKKLHPKLREDGSVREYVVNPYQMAAKEGKYSAITISTMISPITASTALRRWKNWTSPPSPSRACPGRRSDASISPNTCASISTCFRARTLRRSSA